MDALPMLPTHNRYDFSVIDERPDYSWPDGKRLAFCPVTNLEVYAFRKGTGWDPAKMGEPQNQRNYSWRDYGNRVGIWRLFDLFDELGIPAAHNVNSLLYADHPQIFERIRKRDDEVVAHGRTNAERQGELWEFDERRLIDDVTREIARREGRRPSGWMGPAASESNATPDLLKEAGYRYVMDWPADDQPFWLRTRSGPILSVPYPAELNDSASIIHRRDTAEQFCDMIVAGFDEMVEACVSRPLVMTISLHAFVIGQPFRLPYLRKALRHCVEHPKRDRVWWTTPGAVADHCYGLPAGIVPGDGDRAGAVAARGPVAPPPLVPSPALAVAGSAATFPVRRIYCVGRNYVDHIREMKEGDERDPPFFFQKPSDAVVQDGATIPYPPDTDDLQFEIELVVAVGTGGRDIPADSALDHVYGYAAGIDLTRRDQQRDMRAKMLPWERGKAFDASAPCGPIQTVAQVGHPASGAITLAVNGVERQRGDLSQMIWNVREIIANLSASYTLAPGDLIMTGTPAGVGTVVPGDRIEGFVEGVGAFTVTIGPSGP
jgi:allantoinase